MRRLSPCDESVARKQSCCPRKGGPGVRRLTVRVCMPARACRGYNKNTDTRNFGRCLRAKASDSERI
ncbi:hypothetical protein ACU8KH_04193 [Lachancea thermotolerans]